MLPEKLESMAAAVDELRSELDTTCRHIARVRGKVLHYGCAIAYVAVAAASLSQAIHKTEGGLALTNVPTPREEASRPFQWDSHRRLSARAPWRPWTLSVGALKSSALLVSHCGTWWPTTR